MTVRCCNLIDILRICLYSGVCVCVCVCEKESVSDLYVPQLSDNRWLSDVIVIKPAVNLLCGKYSCDCESQMLIAL